MPKRTIILALSLALGLGASAQNAFELRGAVTGERGEPLPFATIATSADSLGKSVGSFAVSGQDGSFKVKIKDTDAKWWVTVRSVGYQTHRQAWGKETFLRIRMREDSKTIADVTVKASAYGAKVGTDTVTFTTSVFRNGSEQNMADVIKKLPGMAVQEDGSMTFKGQKVEKFMVDGKDALSGGSATKTLPADFAESVELIENYSDGNVADAFSSRRKTAMNIKTDGTRKTAVYAQAMGGAKNKFDLRSSAFSFGSAQSGSATFNVNNTGEAVFSIMDYINASGGMSSLSEAAQKGEALTISDEEYSILAKGEDEHKRTAGVASANATITGRSGYTLNISAIGHATAAKGRSESSVEYATGNGPLRRTNATSDDKEGRLATALLNQKLDRGGRLSLRATTKLMWTRNDKASAHNENETYDTTTNHNDDTWLRSAGVSQTLTVSTLRDGRMAYYGLSLTARHSDSRTRAATDRRLPDALRTDAGFGQKRETKELGASCHAGVIVPIGLGVGIKGQATASTELWKAKADAGQGNEKLTDNTVSAYAGLTRAKGLWTFDAGAQVVAYGQKADTGRQGEWWKWAVEPSVRMGWAFSKASKLAANASYKYAPRSLDDISRMTLLTAYDALRLPSAAGTEGSRQLKADLTYSLFSQFSRTVVYATVSYGKETGAVMKDYTTDGYISTQQNREGGRNETASVKAYLNKGIGGIPLYVKASAETGGANTRTSRGGEAQDMKDRNVRGTLGLQTRFHSIPVNAEVSGNYSWARTQIERPDIENTGKNYGAKAAITYSRKKFSATLTGKWSKGTNSSYSVVDRDADIAASYKWKFLTFKVSGMNIGHLDGRDWVTESTTPSVCTTSRYGRMPGHIMAGVSINK